MASLSHSIKRGSAELAILMVLKDQPLHGYEIARRIEQNTAGVLHFTLASLYPLLYRLEARGWIAGRWVEKAGERRRRFYRLTPAGRRMLAEQRSVWQGFVAAMSRITGGEHA